MYQFYLTPSLLAQSFLLVNTIPLFFLIHIPSISDNHSLSHLHLHVRPGTRLREVSKNVKRPTAALNVSVLLEENPQEAYGSNRPDDNQESLLHL